MVRLFEVMFPYETKTVLVENVLTAVEAAVSAIVEIGRAEFARIKGINPDAYINVREESGEIIPLSLVGMGELAKQEMQVFEEMCEEILAVLGKDGMDALSELKDDLQEGRFGNAVAA